MTEEEKLKEKSPMAFLVLTLVNGTAQGKDAHTVATEIMRFTEDYASSKVREALEEIEPLAENIDAYELITAKIAEIRANLSTSKED